MGERAHGETRRVQKVATHTSPPLAEAPRPPPRARTLTGAVVPPEPEPAPRRPRSTCRAWGDRARHGTSRRPAALLYTAGGWHWRARDRRHMARAARLAGGGGSEGKGRVALAPPLVGASLHPPAAAAAAAAAEPAAAAVARPRCAARAQKERKEERKKCRVDFACGGAAGRGGGPAPSPPHPPARPADSSLRAARAGQVGQRRHERVDPVVRLRGGVRAADEGLRGGKWGGGERGW